MSRKTKADLEAEIQELLAENKELRYLANINHDQYKRCHNLLSRYREEMSKKLRGPRKNMTKGQKRQAFLIQEYKYFISLEFDDKMAWKKANDELKDNDKLCLRDKKGKIKGYGRTQLNKIIDKYLSEK